MRKRKEEMEKEETMEEKEKEEGKEREKERREGNIVKERRGDRLAGGDKGKEEMEKSKSQKVGD